MLFHYHYWTPFLEETERYYESQGFEVYQRLGKFEGNFQSFDPPLSWDDFREKGILFRIIEMRKGNVNITFGYGKKVMFDHIGLIKTDKEHDQICRKVDAIGWDVNIGERRTFISTPYGFRVELQTHPDVLEASDLTIIENMKVQTKEMELDDTFYKIFSLNPDVLESKKGAIPSITNVRMTGIKVQNSKDPNGVWLSSI
ncbi:hypothetical protein [Pseudalkalibacillus berkeleyi]|uniref:VOC domain-containing protein n=1 Tax=Pseudalkalibacillus berkeleyi TaxID=1069813 RepID=A0ABS9H0Y5_9BACL|nr:hypothetical protein [Pseudalkalibacillus berkeleyi]MCF6137467.1 hypothetical protein [Pseudalkalibacillus berkeleyi]